MNLFMLVATPILHDILGWFDRTVLVVQKLEDNTHRGVIINLVRVMQNETSCHGATYGGPQSPKDMKCILSVADGQVYLDYQDGQSTSPADDYVFEADSDDRVYVSFGDAGWGEGQLESEIERGVWYKLEVDAKWIRDPDYETLWRRMVVELGGNPDDHVSSVSAASQN